MTTIERVPIAEQLVRWSDDEVALVGSRCTGCGSHYFPTSLSCRNPNCADKNLEEALLGRRGTLYSFTVQTYRPPALFQMEPFEPYAIGLVDVSEGLRVLGMLTGFDLDRLEIGTPVELTVEALCTDSSGREVMTYKYRPSAEAKSS